MRPLRSLLQAEQPLSPSPVKLSKPLLVLETCLCLSVFRRVARAHEAVVYFCLKEQLMLSPIVMVLTSKSLFWKQKLSASCIQFVNKFSFRFQSNTHQIDFKYIFFISCVFSLYSFFFFFSQKTALQSNNQNQVTHTQAHYATYSRQSCPSVCWQMANFWTMSYKK